MLLSMGLADVVARRPDARIFTVVKRLRPTKSLTAAF